MVGSAVQVPQAPGVPFRQRLPREGPAGVNKENRASVGPNARDRLPAR